MTISDRTEILLTTYRDIQSHLRATDEKRDHLLEIYFAIIIAMASGLVVLRATGLAFSAGLAVPVTLILGALVGFGATVFFAMIGARKWHAEYINCSILIQAMMTSQTYDVRPELVPREQREPFVGSMYTSRAFVLVQIGLAVTVFTGGDILAIGEIGNVGYVGAAVVTSVVLAISRITAGRMLSGAEERFWRNPRTSWVLTGLWPTGSDD